MVKENGYVLHLVGAGPQTIEVERGSRLGKADYPLPWTRGHAARWKGSFSLRYSAATPNHTVFTGPEQP